MSSLPGRCRKQNRNGNFRFLLGAAAHIDFLFTTLSFTKKPVPRFFYKPSQQKTSFCTQAFTRACPKHFKGHVPRAGMSQERACPVPSILKACPNSGPVPTILKGLSQDRACRSHDNVQNSTANRSARGHGGASAILVAMRRNTFEITI